MLISGRTDSSAASGWVKLRNPTNGSRMMWKKAAIVAALDNTEVG
jgi:hypothetical protein